MMQRRLAEQRSQQLIQIATMAGEENSNPQSEGGGGVAAMEIDEPSSKVAARRDETQLPWVEKYRPKR